MRTGTELGILVVVLVLLLDNPTQNGILQYYEPLPFLKTYFSLHFFKFWISEEALAPFSPPPFGYPIHFIHCGRCCLDCGGGRNCRVRSLL